MNTKWMYEAITKIKMNMKPGKGTRGKPKVPKLMAMSKMMSKMKGVKQKLKNQ